MLIEKMIITINHGFNSIFAHPFIFPKESNYILVESAI